MCLWIPQQSVIGCSKVCLQIPGSYIYQTERVCRSQFSLVFSIMIRSNENSENSHIGLADLFFFLLETVLKVHNNYRCAFMHIDA